MALIYAESTTSPDSQQWGVLRSCESLLTQFLIGCLTLFVVMFAIHKSVRYFAKRQRILGLRR